MSKSPTSSATKPQRAGHLLRQSPALRALKNAAHAQERLLALVRSLLPESLRLHCNNAQLHDEQLFLYCSSSSWASRLRYCSRDLTASLREKGLPIRKIVVRVSIDAQQACPRKIRRIQPLSGDNAQLIREIANDITDPQLRSALQRLSKHRR